MNLKKFLASILSIAMLVGILPTAALADYVYDDGVLTGVTADDPETLPTYTLELFDDEFNKISASDVDKTGTDPFYLGIKMTNFDKFDMMNKYGLSALALEIDFDENYLTLEPTMEYIDADTVIDRVKSYKSTNFYATKTAVYKPSEITGNPRGYTLQATSGTSDDIVTFIVAPSQAAYPAALSNEEYLGFVEFKVKAVPEVKTKVFTISTVSDGNSLAFGSTVPNKLVLAYNAPSQLENYLVLDESQVDLFPTGNAKLEGLAIKTTDPAYTFPTQYKGRALNVGDLTLSATIGSTTTDVAKDAEGVAYYYGDSNAESIDALTAISGNLPDDDSLASKYAYAAYTYNGVTKFVQIGSLNPQTDTITKIEPATGYTAPTSAFTGSNVDLSGLKVKLTWASSTTPEDNVTYTNLASKGLAVYAGDKASGADVALSTVPAAYPATADQETYFFVAHSGLTTLDTTSTTPYYQFTVTATADTTTITNAQDSTAKTVYGEGKALDLSGVKLNVKKESEDTATTKTYQELVSGNIVHFYYADPNGDVTYATNSANAITSTTTYSSDDMAGKKIYAVPQDNTTATPVEIAGPLADRKIKAEKATANVVNLPSGVETPVYGDKLDKLLSKDASNMSVVLTYDNGDTETFTYDSADKSFKTADGLTLASQNVSLRLGSADVTDAAATALIPTAGLTDTEKANYTLKFVYSYNDGTADQETVVAETDPYTVNKKTVNVILDNPTAPSKTYDGTPDVEADDVTALNVKIDADDLLTADADLADAIGVTGLTFAYADKNVGATKAINVTGTATAARAGTGTDDDVTDFNSKYTLTLSADNFENGVIKNVNAVIEAKTLNVTAITGVPSVEVGAETGLTGTSTLALKNNSTDDTNSDLVKGDVVTLTYKYDYTNADRSQAGTPNVDITATGTEGNVTLGLSGTDAGNYTLGNLPTETKGEVANKTLNSITVNTAPTASYTYPDTKLDVTDIKIDLNYEGTTAPTTIDLDKFLADGGIITLTDKAGQTQTITADNAEGVIDLAYGETTLNIAYGGKTVTTKVTTNKKAIKLSEIVFTASKVYGGTDVTKTATPAAGAIEAADADAVQFTFDAAFTDENAGENKEVTISNVQLVKKGEGEADLSANYVIVDDNGTPITAETAATIDTGIISQGEQVLATAPTATVDENTNNIVVNLDGENLEFSIDGTNWQDAKTFADLAKGTEYTVQARIKASADGNLAPSEPKTVTAATYKYHVARYKKGATKVTDEIYTNTASVASDSDINTNVFSKKPSSFKAYYTDSTCATKVDYTNGYTLSPETVFYYTTSSGGGGGSSSSVTITLDKTSLNGETGGSEKVTATVNGSTATPKWTSSDEKVATVDENGNVTFVGEGKATIKVNVSGTVKSIPVTVTAAAATPTPTPTVTPTDKPSEPVIDVNYTKPYASGYEDDSFRPENNITRAELAAMIARLSYGDDIPDGMYEASFEDVSDDAWYNKYIGYLEGLDVLSGYEDGTFRPDNTVTRGEISTVIARAQRFDLITYSGIFTDVTDYDWAKDYIQTLADKGIISGYEDGSFGPYSPLTRAEAVTIINNVLAPSTPIVTFTPNDIAGHWAEANIILAVNERQVNGTVITEPEPTEVPEEVAEPVEETNSEEESADEETDVSEEVTDEEAEVPAE